MSYQNQPAILLVRADALLPPKLVTENASFLPGWRMVKNLDDYAIRRSMRETNWSFLRLRGGKETRLIGGSREKTLRKGVAQLLSELRGRKFNSLEVTVLAARHFLGMTFLSVSVNLRHFQYNVPVGNLGKAGIAV
jgi:hypothetical protein